VRAEPKAIGIAAVTQLLHHEQDSVFLAKWPFSWYCVIPRDRIFEWWYNSSSRSVAARILLAK